MEPTPTSRRRRIQPSRKPNRPADFADGVNDFAQLALWTSANLAGMVSGMLTARRPFFRKLLRRLYPTTGRVARPLADNSLATTMSAPTVVRRRPTREESFPMLADAVIGSTKETIAQVFGPPRGAVLAGAAPTAATTFWQADTWYYALPKIKPMAIAIIFDNELARTVDFFSPPVPR